MEESEALDQIRMVAAAHQLLRARTHVTSQRSSVSARQGAQPITDARGAGREAEVARAGVREWQHGRQRTASRAKVRTTRGQCTRPTFLASLQAASPLCAPRPRATYTRAEHPWPSSRFSVQCSPKQPVPRSHWSAAVAACGWWQSSALGGLSWSIRLRSARRRRFVQACGHKRKPFVAILSGKT